MAHLSDYIFSNISILIYTVKIRSCHKINKCKLKTNQTKNVSLGIYRGLRTFKRLFYEVVEIKMKIALVLLVQIVQPNWGAAVREGEAGEGAAVSIMKRETSTKGEERHLEFGREKKEFLSKPTLK